MLQRCSRGDAGVRTVGMELDGTGLKAAALCFWWAGWEEEGVLRMGESEKQTHLLSPSNHALRVCS